MNDSYDTKLKAEIDEIMKNSKHYTRRRHGINQK